MAQAKPEKAPRDVAGLFMDEKPSYENPVGDMGQHNLTKDRMTHGKRRIRVTNGIIYDDDAQGSAATAEEIHVSDRDTFTGLYDHNGTPLHRQPEPVGYNPHRWSNAMPNPNQKQPKPKKKGR